jgi:multidrug efflux pump subunit AcrA (membrane-fusion protein)
MNKKKMIIWSAVGLLVVLGGFRIATHRGKAAAKTDTPVAVKAMLPRIGEAVDTIELSGTVSAKEEANAYSGVPGKVVRFDKVEGDRVEKDEPIAWVERDEVGLTFSLSPVKAPIAGLVAQKLVDIGEAVTPNITGVASVVNPRELEVLVNIIEKDLGRVVKGQEVQVKVEAYPQDIFKGRISRIAPVVDRLSKTTRVVVSLEPVGGKLKSGMFADVSILVARKPKALLVPQEAVMKQDQDYFVYSIRGDKAVRRKVELGWMQNGEQEITSGLSANEEVIVQGQTRLSEATRIQAVKGE